MLSQSICRFSVLKIPHERSGIQKADGRDAEWEHVFFILTIWLSEHPIHG